MNEQAALRSRRRRTAGLVLAVSGAAILTVGWALPNVAGSVFLHVRAVVVAVPSESGPQVTVGSAVPVRAVSLSVSADVENSYPLSVVVATDPVAYSAAVYSRGPSGALVRVWQSGVGDATVEEGSDSPVGGGSDGAAIAVPSGTTNHEIATGKAGYALLGKDGAAVAGGVYYVRVWAYGIGSPLVPVIVDDGASAALRTYGVS